MGIVAWTGLATFKTPFLQQIGQERERGRKRERERERATRERRVDSSGPTTRLLYVTVLRPIVLFGTLKNLFSRLRLFLPLKMVCEPQQLFLESIFKASSRYSEHIPNNQKPRKFHSEAVGSSEDLARTGPISRNPLVTRRVHILWSC